MDGPLCVYAVVRADARCAVSEQEGIGQAPVSSVDSGGVAALVSEAPAGRLRPTRANLNAHEQVVCAVHAVAPVIPVRFGTVMPDTRSVEEQLLAPNVSRFASTLDELADKDEFRLKARYLPGAALRDVVDRSPAVRKLRDRVSGGGRTTMGEQIRLGELVFGELDRLKESDSSAVLEALAPQLVSWRPLDNASEDVAVHVACLVQRNSRDKWDASLDSLADKGRRRLRFEVVGPLPPWDFNDFRLEVA